MKTIVPARAGRHAAGERLRHVDHAHDVHLQHRGPIGGLQRGRRRHRSRARPDRAPRVNTVNPGMVKTKLNQNVWRAWNEQQPPERQRTYED